MIYFFVAFFVRFFLSIFDIFEQNNYILWYFFAVSLHFFSFDILFIFNTLSFCIVLKSVKMRKFFCRYQKKIVFLWVKKFES